MPYPLPNPFHSIAKILSDPGVNMPHNRQVVAVAGVGHLGRYVCEELLACPDFDVVVLARGVSESSDTGFVGLCISKDSKTQLLMVLF